MTDMKKCRKCEQEFPATKEYFRTRKNFKDGLSARCKSCEKEDEQRYQYAQPDPNMVKKCSNCHTSYPATTEFFYPLKTGRYGLTAKCRTCTLEINRQRNIPLNTDPNILKRCSKCGSEYPATSDYFSPDKQGTYGVTGQCKTCRRENTQKWRDENPGKVEDYNKSYYAEHKEQENARSKQFHIRNSERVNKRHRDRYEENPENSRGATQRWRKKYPIKHALQSHRRRTRLENLPNTLTEAEWKNAVAHWDGCCAYCATKPDNLTLDHFIPSNSKLCPGTVASNIVPACFPCNASKGDRSARHWLKVKFGEERAKLAIEMIETYFESLKKK